MSVYVGLDVSQRTTAICVVDAAGSRLWQGAVPTNPVHIARAVREHSPGPCKVGMETGPLAVWLYHALRQESVDVDCIHAKHVHAALTVQLNKTDRNDAFGIAQLVRSGWYTPTHVRSLESHQSRLLLTARSKLVSMRTATSNQIRGLLKTFGVVLGPGKRRAFDDGVAQADPTRDGIRPIVAILLQTWRHLNAQIREIDRRIQAQARQDPVCKLLMSVPGVGAITAVSFRAAVDEPSRFRRVTDVGPFLGLVPRKYQSGDVDRNGAISKQGDRSTRSTLYEAALALLRRYGTDTPLAKWATRIEGRHGLRKAVIALARKLATVLLSMWRSGEPYRVPVAQ